MKINFLSHDILDPDLVLRLKKEGNDVVLFEKEKSKTLDGSVKKLPFNKRMDNLKGVDLFVYDDVGFGDEPADLRKQGYSVVGGSSKSDAMELDRIKGAKIAQLAGLNVPETKEFTSIKDIIDYLKENKGRKVLKQFGKIDGCKGLNFISKVDDNRDMITYLEWVEERWVEGLPQTFVIQDFIEGHEVAVGAYFSGEDWMKDKDGDIFCEINMEHKALMAGDMGVSTGETFTLMKYLKAKDCKLFQETLGKLTDILKKIDFVGDADANCIIDEQGAHFLEFTMRFGSPATSSQIAIHKTKWGEFLKACADKKNISFEYDPRWTIVAWLFTPPFPHSMGDIKVNENPKNIDEMKDLLEHRLSNTEDLVIDFKEKLSPEELNNVHLEYVYYKDGKIKLANNSGYVFTITGQGDTPKEAGEATAKLLKKILVPKGFYRNDFTSHYDKSKKDLIKWGYLQDDSTVEEQLKAKEEQEAKDKQTKEITEKISKEYDDKLKTVKDAVRKTIYG